jgi:hypothetical protein
MTKQNGIGDQLYVDGYNLSGDIGSLGNIRGGPAALEVTGIDKGAPERVGGERDGSIDFTAWFNDAAGQAHLALGALPTGARYVTYLRGQGIGAAAAALLGRQIGYDPNRGNDGQLTLGVSTQADGYGLEWGEQLTAGIRTDTAGTNGTALDFGATSTTFGGQAYLQVFSVTGTSATVKLQDSADNSTFADLSGAAFAAATGRGAQRIAFTGTVRRYVRAVTTGTFTNAQFSVIFVRNLTAVTF